MATNGRNKGATFERDIAKMLDDELGISFKRNLDQYRESGLGDLIPSDPEFPFTLELKRYADGPIGGQSLGGRKLALQQGAKISTLR